MVANGTISDIGPYASDCFLIETTESRKKALFFIYACIVLWYAAALILEARSFMDL